MNERKHFEAWATVAAFAVIPDGDGYTNTVTHRAWEAWQAAKSDQAEELAKAQARIVQLEDALKQARSIFIANHSNGGASLCLEALAATDDSGKAMRDNWIPVSERLPDTPIKLGELKLPNGEKFKPQENSYDVLIWRRGGSADITHLIRASDGTTCWYLFNGEVTHWQPLPPSPAKETK